MEKNEIYCALCGRIPECEEPAVLAMGKYGKPRHLCEECEEQMDIATLGRDYDEVVDAIDVLGKKATGFGKDDEVTMNAMRAFLMRAAKRAAAIKDGSYDFDSDNDQSIAEESDEEGFDEVPEELLETEEDAELDRRDAEKSKLFDKIMNWFWVGAFSAVFLLFLLKFVFHVI